MKNKKENKLVIMVRASGDFLAGLSEEPFEGDETRAYRAGSIIPKAFWRGLELYSKAVGYLFIGENITK
ncbi:MAG: hypothetical protein PHH54_05365 [Candidatus Nanoarchaeia archaeon]|nr:hypothetical protein [Candidatus Nanoarchaeia archaeon]MDD5741387.1 hypothetical protein [Candidatus Nanoarchaeia archaeon]